MKIYITHLLKILNLFSPFRRFEIKNFLRWPTMVADNISNLVAPPEFFSFLWAWIITYKRGIYELPYELPNDLRLRTSGN